MVRFRSKSRLQKIRQASLGRETGKSGSEATAVDSGELSSGRVWGQRPGQLRVVHSGRLIVENYLTFGAMLLALMLSFRSLFAPDIFQSQDVFAHVFRIDRQLDTIVFNFRLNGWFSGFGVGHDAFLVNAPMLTWITGAIKVLFLGQISTARAVLIMVVIAFCIQPLVVSYMVRSVGTSKRAAGLAAVLSVGVTNFSGLGLDGTFATGLIVQQVAAPMFCLVVATVCRHVVTVTPRPSAATKRLLVGAASSLVLTHLISALVLCLLLPCILLSRRLVSGSVMNWQSWKCLLTCGFWVCGFCAFWLVPLFRWHDVSGGVTTWDPPRIGEFPSRLYEGINFYHRPLNFVVIGSIVLLGVLAVLRIAKDQVETAMVILFAVVIYTLASSLLHDQNLIPYNLSVQLIWRGLPYAALLLVAIPGLMLDVFLEKLPLATKESEATMAIVVAVVVVVSLLDLTQFPSKQINPDRRIIELAQQIRTKVPIESRLIVEDNTSSSLGFSGTSTLARWLANKTNRNVINAFNPELAKSMGVGFKVGMVKCPSSLNIQSSISSQSSFDGCDQQDVALRELATLGATHLVTFSSNATARAAANQTLDQIWSEDSVALFSFDSANLGFNPKSMVYAKGTDLEAKDAIHLDDGYDLELSVSKATEVRLAVGWSPRWRATINGQSAPIIRSSDDNVSLQVQPGISTVKLRYRSDSATTVGVITSLSVALYAFIRWRRRPRELNPSVPHVG